MIILDTNVVSEPMKPNANPAVVAYAPLVNRARSVGNSLGITSSKEILYRVGFNGNEPLEGEVFFGEIRLRRATGI